MDGMKCITPGARQAEDSWDATGAYPCRARMMDCIDGQHERFMPWKA